MVKLLTIDVVHMVLNVVVNYLDLSFLVYSDDLVIEIRIFFFGISCEELNSFFHVGQSFENAVVDRSFVRKVFLVVKKDLTTVFHFHCDVAITDYFLEFSTEYLNISTSQINSARTQLLLDKEKGSGTLSDLHDISPDPRDRAHRVHGDRL